MRFCMVTTFYPPYHFGGDATYVRALSHGLADLGHEVHVVHCEDAYRVRAKGRLNIDAGADERVRVHRLRSRLGRLSPLISQQTGHPGLKSRALSRILDSGFDVIHYHNVSLMGGPAVLTWGRARIKLYTLHEHWLLCPTHVFWKNRSHVCDKPQCFRCSLRSGIPPQLWRYSGLRDRSLSAVDSLLAPSRFTARRHSEWGITAPIRVLPLFSDLDPGPGNPPAPTDRPRFVYVGRVTAVKGIAELVKVFASLPDYDLVVAGSGDLLEPLQARYAECRNIRFVGHLPQAEVVHLYRSATAAILPSLVPETFGLTVVEALACSAPVVVRDAGGSPEIVERSGAGFVYRTDRELNEALRRLATDAALVGSLRLRARAAYESYYTRQSHLTAYLNIIATVT